MRNAAVFQFEQALTQYVSDAGLLTDELEDANTGASAGELLETAGVPDPLDERLLPEGTITVASYAALQAVRADATLAIGQLATYATTSADSAATNVMRGELYAFEGYAEMLLADLFCSGVPLSTLVFQGDFNYAASSTSSQVYHDALAKFDTAMAFGHMSDSVVHLAQVGKARVYLDLGNYEAAADDVSIVPIDFVYQVAVLGSYQGGPGATRYIMGPGEVADSEGQNGLPFRSSGDPRSAAIGVGINPETGDSIYFPTKYSAGLSGVGYAPFTLASWVEAQLIIAEYQLHTGGPWLATLNTLRENTANIVTMTNNTYAADTPLSDLTDPGHGLSDPAAAAARVRLLFRERAFWLFLDGHRQGDLRRLLRQYSTGYNSAFRSETQVYPTGVYLAPGEGTYGNDVTAPIDPGEAVNPKFHGCLDRNP